MDDDQDKLELRAIADQFKKLMREQSEVLDYDQTAKVRLGQMIGQAALNSSEYAYPAWLEPKKRP